MILRTPPPRKRRADSMLLRESPPGSDYHGLVLYESPPPPTHQYVVPESSNNFSEQMLCTYQCRQMVKSEFLDALSNKEKLCSEYETKLQVLNANFCKAESERKKYRQQFLNAEQELAAAKGREKSLQDQLMKGVDDSHERLTKQMQLNNELQVKLQKEISLRKAAETSAASAEEKATQVEKKLTCLLDDKGREIKRLIDELLLLKEKSTLSASRLQADLDKMEFKARRAEKELEIFREQLEGVKRQLNECLHQKVEVEKKLATFTSLSQNGTSTESTILLKNLQEELRSCEAEVREARRLKASHDNIRLLKEKLMEEKRHKERAERELLKLLEIQLRMTNLENELFSWKNILNDIPGVSSPEDILLKLAALQKDVILAEAKLGEANGSLKQVEFALEAALLDKENAVSEAAMAVDKAEVMSSEVKHLQSMLTLVNEERDQLKNTIYSLKKKRKDEAGTEVANELESSLAKKDNYIVVLEGNLHEQRETVDRKFTEIRLLTEKLNGEAKRVKSLERETDRYRSEISLLELKLGHGDYSAANTKVLRMVNTLGLDNEASQTILTLQRELQMASQKLQVVDELKKQSADAGKSVDSYISGKIRQLKEQIATLEKREERYKTVFADKISVFRRACCELFGYKIVMDDKRRPNGIPITCFSLQSIYSQSDDEMLEFEYESGSTNIVMNNYTSQSDISQQVEIFIRKMNSIPAFTANLTVESFNRRTLS
ncbi:hypothetical protein Droror1_Dr00027580 [Drosera rotundifolia]